ncbi:hypothetical protein SLEP1_g50985 [Rubroshorea leprosula]|uniref:Uncharacterized protein n=1 Tax=Rubroshorea leprosula TaxID=152421 RepID=A0AAV5M509_9ROSI|nr:hypothetical protein SLEP1_g50985 [Rubroshorea leprosula]
MYIETLTNLVCRENCGSWELWRDNIQFASHIGPHQFSFFLILFIYSFASVPNPSISAIYILLYPLLLIKRSSHGSLSFRKIALFKFLGLPWRS